MNLKALTSDRLETLINQRKAALKRVSDRAERRVLLTLMRGYYAELASR